MLESRRSRAPDEAVGGFFMESGRTPALAFENASLISLVPFSSPLPLTGRQ